MRSTVLVAAYLLAAIPLLQAQQLSLGLRGGVLVNRQNSNLPITDQNGSLVSGASKYAAGLAVGIPVEVRFGKLFALQPEFNYLQRATCLEVPDFKVTQTENVFELPVLAKVGFARERFALAAVVGPAFHYALNLRRRGTVNGLEVNEQSSFAEGTGFRWRSDYFGIAGAELQVPLGPTRPTFDARYRFQLDGQYRSVESRIRNQGFAATAGVMVSLGKRG